MNDYRDMKMFTRPGRGLALWGLGDPATPIGLVTPWRDDADEATNVEALHDLGSHVRFGRQNLPMSVQHTYVYGEDDRGPCAYLLLLYPAAPGAHGTSLIHHSCRRIVTQFGQPGHVAWDGSAATLFDPAGQPVRELGAFDGTVECLDRWVAAIRPGFQARGVFDRNFSYIQMRWYQTRPKAGGS